MNAKTWEPWYAPQCFYHGVRGHKPERCPQNFYARRTLRAQWTDAPQCFYRSGRP